MKKLLLLSAFFTLTVTSAFSKWVKFSVDMTGQTVSADSIHLISNFQSLLGFGDDYTPNTVTLYNTSGNIYSRTFNLPAGQLYEYKFVNGKLSYFIESVPIESRVDPFEATDDNRWIYVDSISSDTMNIGAIRFSGNAPAGDSLVRFMVDMQSRTVSSNGVHVEGSFQGNSPTTDRMYSFDGITYQYIAYVTPGAYTFRYVNGNTADSMETITGACAAAGVRALVVAADTILDSVCYSSCSLCSATAVAAVTSKAGVVTMYPNPANAYTILQFNDDAASHTVQISDIAGKVVATYLSYAGASLRIERSALASGVYMVKVSGAGGNSKMEKLAIE